MTLIRKFTLFCLVVTMFACSGLRKNGDKNKETLVQITTQYGDMIIELSDKTPLHKANFIKLVKESYYDSLLFHRVISGFMIQGGDPDSKNAVISKTLGNGGPGYTIPAEFDTTLFHKKGAIAAARMGDNVNPKKESSGSQFYITQGKVYTLAQLKQIEASKRNTKPGWNMDSIPGFKFTQEQILAYTTVGGVPFLDAGYTVFGQVIKGVEVIDKIAAVETRNKRTEDRPTSDVMMTMKLIQLSVEEKQELLIKE